MSLNSAPSNHEDRPVNDTGPVTPDDEAAEVAAETSEETAPETTAASEETPSAEAPSTEEPIEEPVAEAAAEPPEAPAVEAPVEEPVTEVTAEPSETPAVPEAEAAEAPAVEAPVEEPVTEAAAEPSEAPAAEVPVEEPVAETAVEPSEAPATPEAEAAETPASPSIEEIAALEAMAADEVSEENAAEDEEEEEEAGDAGEAASEEEERPASKYRRGDIVEGTVLQTSPTEILIQLEDDVQGIVSGRELARMDRSSLDELREGNPVLVYVLNPSNRSGQAVLSLSRALEERDWRQAEEYMESQQLYSGKVSGYNKGGLIVRFGRVRGFVPASQVREERRARAIGESPMERWSSMIGEEVHVKVVEVDRNRNRLILSERAAAKEVRDQAKANLLEQLEVGAIRKGRVVSLTDFGAFVDLGGADGLVHLTELSWKHVTKPSEIVKVGQEVEVEIISLDRERRRIGLSMKSLEKDPWEEVVSNFRVGQLVRGRITKLTKFGAFACLDDAPEIEGLIHISELAEHRVGHPREVVQEGDEVTLRIVKIDRAQRRMGLSLKQVDAVEYLEIDLATYDSEPSEPPDLEDLQSGSEESGESEEE